MAADPKDTTSAQRMSETAPGPFSWFPYLTAWILSCLPSHPPFSSTQDVFHSLLSPCLCHHSPKAGSQGWADVNAESGDPGKSLELRARLREVKELCMEQVWNSGGLHIYARSFGLHRAYPLLSASHGQALDMEP